MFGAEICFAVSEAEKLAVIWLGSRLKLPNLIFTFPINSVILSL